MSDFSIEYILHRAGDRYLGTNCSLGLIHSLHRLLPANSSSSSISPPVVVNNRELFQPRYTSINPLPGALPMLDWLQYTRYHPPKLPRSLRQLGSGKRSPGRLPRIPFSAAQLQSLEQAYRHSNYLSAEEANQLAIALNLSNARVKIWFQNRRARERRDKRAQEIQRVQEGVQEIDEEVQQQKKLGTETSSSSSSSSSSLETISIISNASFCSIEMPRQEQDTTTSEDQCPLEEL